MKFNIIGMNEASKGDDVKQAVANADNGDASSLKDAYYSIGDNMPQLKKSAQVVLGKNSAEYKTIEKIAAMFDQLTLGKYL